MQYSKHSTKCSHMSCAYREIHIRQCGCTVFTTFTSHCHVLCRKRITVFIFFTKTCRQLPVETWRYENRMATKRGHQALRCSSTGPRHCQAATDLDSISTESYIGTLCYSKQRRIFCHSYTLEFTGFFKSHIIQAYIRYLNNSWYSSLYSA